jgi:hypothetical protein
LALTAMRRLPQSEDMQFVALSMFSLFAQHEVQSKLWLVFFQALILYLQIQKKKKKWK